MIDADKLVGVAHIVSKRFRRSQILIPTSIQDSVVQFYKTKTKTCLVLGFFVFVSLEKNDSFVIVLQKKRTKRKEKDYVNDSLRQFVLEVAVTCRGLSDWPLFHVTLRRVT